MADSYTTWIDEQAEAVVAAMRQRARNGQYRDVALYVMPSTGPEGGRLIMANELPPGCKDVVWLSGEHGTHIMRVPYSHVRSLLWDACRSFPILPIPA